MHILNDPKKVVASAVISELQSSDMYLTLAARLFDLRANLNGVRVTEAFLDEIVENEAKYICHPLYADIRGLIANRTVGHMYNARTGEFHSTQIGAFYRFEKELDGDNAYLVGYARVPKRNKALCKALSDLFTDNALKFSFEVNCGVYAKEEDGTMLIDADPRNYWEGEAVVTFPACENAVAMELIAECLGKGDEIMADEITLNAETEVVAAEEAVSDENVVAQNDENKSNDETQNETQNETQLAETENAEVLTVTREHVEIDEVRAFNCDTGEEIQQKVVVETITCTPVTLAEEDHEEDEERKEKHEDDDDENSIVASEENASCEENEDKDEEKEMASVQPDWAKLIAELQENIACLRKEIAELKLQEIVACETVVAQAQEAAEEEVVAERVTADAQEENIAFNPFMASISAPKKYALLEKEEKPVNKYALLERA